MCGRQISISIFASMLQMRAARAWVGKGKRRQISISIFASMLQMWAARAWGGKGGSALPPLSSRLV